jgi:hypothetical protein
MRSSNEEAPLILYFNLFYNYKREVVEPILKVSTNMHYTVKT